MSSLLLTSHSPTPLSQRHCLHCCSAATSQHNCFHCCSAAMSQRLFPLLLNMRANTSIAIAIAEKPRARTIAFIAAQQPQASTIVSNFWPATMSQRHCPHCCSAAAGRCNYIFPLFVIKHAPTPLYPLLLNSHKTTPLSPLLLSNRKPTPVFSIAAQQP